MWFLLFLISNDLRAHKIPKRKKKTIATDVFCSMCCFFPPLMIAHIHSRKWKKLKKKKKPNGSETVFGLGNVKTKQTTQSSKDGNWICYLLGFFFLFICTAHTVQDTQTKKMETAKQMCGYLLFFFFVVANNQI